MTLMMLLSDLAPFCCHYFQGVVTFGGCVLHMGNSCYVQRFATFEGSLLSELHGKYSGMRTEICR